MKFYTHTDFDKSHLTFSECQIIHEQILDSSNKLDSEFQVYWKELVKSCIEYTEARGKWLLLSREDKMNFDSTRTTIHNKVIHNLKLIKALTLENNKDCSWYEKFQDDRKRIGDFANYLVYAYAINAR